MAERRRQVVELNFPSSAEPGPLSSLRVSRSRRNPAQWINRDCFPTYPSFVRNKVAAIHKAESHCAMQSLLVISWWLCGTNSCLLRTPDRTGLPICPSPAFTALSAFCIQDPSSATPAAEAYHCHCQAPGTVPGHKSRTAHRERHTKLDPEDFEMFPEFLLLEVRVWDPNRMKGSTSPSPPIPDR